MEAEGVAKTRFINSAQVSLHERDETPSSAADALALRFPAAVGDAGSITAKLT